MRAAILTLVLLSVGCGDAFSTGAGGAPATGSVGGGGNDAATTTAATMGGGGGGPATTTAAAGGGSPEDCSNGIDDDGDGLGDCEDSDCTCLPALAQGSYVLPADASDKCQHGTSITRFQCDECACNVVQPLVCQTTFKIDENPACDTAMATFDSSTNGACVTVAQGDYRYFKLTGTGLNTDAECLPSEPTVGSSDLALCQLQPGTCSTRNGTGFCVPAETSCLLVDANECPDELELVARLYPDPPTCSCSCNAASCPDESVTVYTDDNCGDFQQTIDDTTCTDVGTGVVSARSAPIGPSCHPSVAAPGAGQPTLYCCAKPRS